MYFTVMALLAILLGAFGSVFNTFAGLYLAKDNDLLLSMPIPVRYILAARLRGVYLLGLMYSGVLLLPAVIVYWCMASFSLQSVLGGILLILTVSGIVLFLSCALGWVVAQISRKLRNKSLITVLISLIFIGAYYFFYAKAQSPMQDLIANADSYGAKIRGAAYPLYLLGRMGVGDPVALLVWIAGTALVLFPTLYIIARGFIRLATSTGTVARTAYREKKKARVASPPGTPAAGICPLSRQSDLYAQLRSRLGNRRCVRRVPADPQQLGLRKSVGAVRGGGDRYPPLCPHRRRCRMHGAIHDSNHRALGFAGGQDDPAVAEPAGHAVAGASCQAGGTSVGRRNPGAAVRRRRGGSTAAPLPYCRNDSHSPASLYPAASLLWAVRQPSAPQPDVGQRDDTHQAESGRTVFPARRLGLCRPCSVSAATSDRSATCMGRLLALNLLTALLSLLLLRWLKGRGARIFATL